MDSTKPHTTLIAAVVAVGVAAAGWVVQLIETDTVKQRATAAEIISRDMKKELKTTSVEGDATFKVCVERLEKLSLDAQFQRVIDEWQNNLIMLLLSQQGGRRVRKVQPPTSPVSLNELQEALPRTPEAAVAEQIGARP